MESTVTNNRPGTATGRRAEAREKIADARQLLIDAARAVDGDYETIRHSITNVIVALDDAKDAIQTSVEADLRAWADSHGENAGELAAEARGEC